MRKHGELTDAIRVLLERGYDAKSIATMLETTKAYVGLVRWRLKHPGYHPKWMRKVRRKDAARRRERQLYRISRRHKEGNIA